MGGKLSRGHMVEKKIFPKPKYQWKRTPSGIIRLMVKYKPLKQTKMSFKYFCYSPMCEIYDRQLYQITLMSTHSVEGVRFVVMGQTGHTEYC